MLEKLLESRRELEGLIKMTDGELQKLLMALLSELDQLVAALKDYVRELGKEL